MRIKVTFSGTSKWFVIEETDKIDDLLLVFRRVFEVDNNITEFRVISKGRDITREAGDVKTLIGEEGKVMIIGSDGRDLATTMQKKKKIEPRPVASLNLSEASMRKRYQSGPSTSSNIAAIRELTHLPRSNEARDILIKIASDPGIKGVMDKHNFKVGLLTELHPIETKEELRGLNKNKGQEILLKLRNRVGPDDMDLFLSYSEIRDTMLHELTHNVHGPHDEKFYTLFRQLVKEQKTLDWTTGGRRVGGHDVYQPPPTDYSTSQTYSSGARVLGGDMQKFNEINRAGYTPSQVAYAAATLRLSEAEKKCEQGCGSVSLSTENSNESSKRVVVEPLPAPSVSKPESTPTPMCCGEDSASHGRETEPASTSSTQEGVLPPDDQPPPTPVEPVERVSCPVCNELLPAGCSTRFISNHVESCVKPPPIPEEMISSCPICEVSFPEGSTERYINNHVSQCVGGGGVQIEENVSPPKQNEAPILKLNSSSSSAAAEAPPVEVGGAVSDSFPVHSCPICCDPFPASSSERFRNNHVEQCMLKEAA
eukprot:TRINITY_DN1310_c1_g2_i1.p1 TRINITY_DN1310_c1_g2~~TRINITY_DN1310_c1_g2_i1.p1  ORF type:complete len:539 (+),score=79.16 TRINITY_DN1310_c1_g2_i1:60-1676(+)